MIDAIMTILQQDQFMALMAIYLGVPLIGTIVFIPMFVIVRKRIFVKQIVQELLIYWFRNVGLAILFGAILFLILNIILFEKQYIPFANLSILTQVFLFLIVIEFVSYVLHMAMHKVRFLRKYHSVHHQQYRLNWTNATRERVPALTVLVFFFILTGKYLGVHFIAAAGAVILYELLAMFAHTGLPWSFGPFEYIFVSPQRHRIHHNFDLQHKVNFGGSLSIFDYIFKTATPRSMYKEDQKW